MPPKVSRGPWLWPLLLTIIGVVLLLNNFLLLGDFNISRLWPLILVIIGAAILVRGDLAPSTEARTFGITRGSVESATLEINSGEIDVQIRGLQQEGRLIAGQYALSSKPAMRAADTHAHLKMDRSATPWLSFSDWQMGIARDLPWRLLISTHLGQVNLDLSPLIIQGAVVATGIGDIRIVSPVEALEPLHVQSTFGSIHVVTPVGYRSRITVQGGRMFQAHADQHRYEQVEPNVFVAYDPEPEKPLVDITVAGTFGDAYLT